MTQQEKLQALIEKAIDGGWDNILLDCQEYNPWTKTIIEETYEQYDGRPVYSFIFNHSFAKSLWGEDTMWLDPAGFLVSHYQFEDDIAYEGEVIPWQYHLQQAVISENPIGYMYQTVFGEKI